jgi:dethiobiotin synthetase
VSGYFITATGTDIGKTYVTARLVRALGATAIKPIMSGYDAASAAGSDAGMLLTAMGRAVTQEAIAAISPWRFAAPLSPDMAAAREGGAIAFPELLTFCKTAIAAAPGLLLIEGVGGVMVPLDKTHTVRDWIVALNLPVLLVAGSYLGSLSHTLTGLEALRAAAIEVAGIVLNESLNAPVPMEETAATLTRFCNIPIHLVERDADTLTWANTLV